ncbi:uncharacterized protein [Ranitomeya imitator]|uniref:uncharacterized protein isoform X1 n=1 Tax=Ranitomeya imitator TaxID=111125 RepID=UPI0037E7468C
MESVKTAIKLLFHHCFMVVLDLKDAYYHVPIHIDHQRFLRVAVSLAGTVEHFQYQALPFGVAVAPRVFTKIMVEVMAHLHEQDILIVPYLDDLLIVGHSESHCSDQLQKVMDALHKLGWMINIKKSRLQPLKVQEFLGYVIDSSQQECRLPDTKVAKIKRLVTRAINNPLVSVRGAMSILGSLTSCIPAVLWAQFHTRALQWDVLHNSRRLNAHLDSKFTLSAETVHSLGWWTHTSNLHRGVPWINHISRVLTTDASPKGWGAHLGEDWVQGLWSLSEQDSSSNLKELLAVKHALNRFLVPLQGRHVRLLSDNRVTVAYINRQGGTRSSTLMEVANHIFQVAEVHLLSLTALHIKGSINTKADYLSRNMLRQGEWSLNPAIFSQIIQLWGCPEIDLFANRGNKKLHQFCSLNPRQPIRCGRSADILALQARVCFSPSKSNSPSPEEDSGGQGPGNLGSSILAQEGLVSLAEKDVCLPTMDSSRATRSALPGTNPPSSSSQLTPSGMELERSLLRGKGFSQNLVNTLLKSRKPSTTGIYVRVWRKFLSFSGTQIDQEPCINQVLEFLQKGLEMGLATSTLRVQVSALGALYNLNLASNHWIARFFKAVTRSRPIIKQRLVPWDLNLVLSALTQAPFEPIDTIPVKILSIKTALLVALTSARRVSDLQALSRHPPYMQVREDRVILKPDPLYLPKVASKFHRVQEVVLPSFCSNPTNDKERKFHCLDVRRCLLRYITVSDSWKKDNSLFVAYQGVRKGLRVSKNTLARWIREAISLAYTAGGNEVPDGIKAHSTRAMASSWAERSEVSIEDICKAATWSSPSTFLRHYRLDLGSSSDLTFGRRVLEAIIPP